MPILDVRCYPNNEIRLRFSSAIPDKSRDGRDVREDAYRARLLDEYLATVQPDPNWREKVRKPEPKESQEGRNSDVGWGELPKERNFSTLGIRKLLRVGGVVDRLFQRDCSVFFTGTLPGSTDSAIDALSAYSAYAVNRVSQWVRRHSENACYFFVWELQARGALHLHYCGTFQTLEKAEEMRANWSAFWSKLIDDIGSKAGVDMWAKADGGTWANNKQVLQADAQIVRKSIAAYLTRYTVSGANNLHKLKTKKGQKLKRVSFPSRWWGVSRWLSQKLKEMSIHQRLNLPAADSPQYQELIETLPQKIGQLIHHKKAVRFYDYKDFVGSGHNWVIYSNPCDGENLFSEILSWFPVVSPVFPGAKLRQRALDRECEKQGYSSIGDWWNFEQIKQNALPKTLEQRIKELQIQQYCSNSPRWKFSAVVLDLYGLSDANAYCQFFVDLLSTGREELAKQVELELEQKYLGWQSYVNFEDFNNRGWFIDPEYVIKLNQKEAV